MKMKAIVLIQQKFILFIYVIFCQLQHLILASIESRIHYGEESSIFMESVGKIPIGGGEQFCSAVIIGENLLLTATHCFKFHSETTKVISSDKYEFHTICNGKMKIFHLNMDTLLLQKYSNGKVRVNNAHDVAAIRIDEDFNECSENKIAKVTCGQAKDGSKMVLGGYGKNELGSSGILKWITVKMDLYRDVYDFDASYKYDYLYAFDCVGDKIKRNDHGDSGGPCFDEHWNVIGVIRETAMDATKCFCTPLYPFYDEYLFG